MGGFCSSRKAENIRKTKKKNTSGGKPWVEEYENCNHPSSGYGKIPTTIRKN